MSKTVQAQAAPLPYPDARAVRLGFLAAGVLVMCWSGFNIVSRLGGRSPLTPWDLTALRFSVAGAVLSPWFVASVRARSLPWVRRIALALTGGLAYALLVYVGFSLAPASHAGVLVNGGIPLATSLIGWWGFGQRPTRRAGWALVLTICGMLLIGRHAFQSADGASTLGGDACFLAAAASWGLYGQLVRRWQVDPRTAAASITVCSAALYLPFYLEWLPKGYGLATTGQIALQAGYQGLVAGVVASFCYMFATLRIGPTRASLMLALVPPISACLAVPLLGETLTLETGLGALLVTGAALFGASGGSGVRR